MHLQFPQHSSLPQPFNTIRSILMKPKDKTPIGVVSYTTFSVITVKPVASVSPKSKYKVQRTYTARKGIHSAVREHIDTSGHKCCMEDIKISDKKENWYHRKVKEAILIQQHNPSFNGEKGLELVRIYFMLLLSDSRELCDNSAPHSHH